MAKKACDECGERFPLDQLTVIGTGELSQSLCKDCLDKQKGKGDAVESSPDNKNMGHMAAEGIEPPDKDSLIGGNLVSKQAPVVQGPKGGPDISKQTDDPSECFDCSGKFQKDALTKWSTPRGTERMLCPDCLAARQKKATKDSADDHSVPRQDFCDLPSADYMTTTFKRTPEGYLKGRAIVTNIGVFTYKDANGTHTELRLPEEVFDSDSLESLKLKPLTNDHPDVKKSGGVVTVENIKELQVGNLGNNPSSTTQRNLYGSYADSDELTDGYHVAIDLIIQDPSAIQDIMNGKQSLSCGYNCDLDQAEAGARWCGVPYDYIQRRIRYNHVAIVDKARAGDMATIKLDSADAAVQIKPHQEEIMKKITLDGVEYEAEAPVIAALSKATARADAADESLKALQIDQSKLTADRDALKERNDSLTKDLDEAKKAAVDPVKLDAAIQAKLQLRLAASRAGVEIKADSKDEDLQKAVILKVFPQAKLDGKDVAYLQARFDSAVEQLGDIVNADATTAILLGGGLLPSEADMAHQDQEDSEAVVETARTRYLARLKGGKLNTDADLGAAYKEA